MAVHYWKPTGPWKSSFRKALRNAFTPPELDTLISDYFTPEAFTAIAPVGLNTTYEYQIHQVIEHARRHDWIIDLVAAAHERRPKNPEIAVINEDLGLTITGPRLDNPTGKPLEEIIQSNAAFIDPSAFRERLFALEGQVCWVDIPGGGGTGFLVGPDLILTNYHVVERVKAGHARWQDVSCKFDYKRAIDNSTLARKRITEVQLDAEWLVAHLPPSQYDWNPTLGNADPTELDYALLRLADQTGNRPVGGDTADLKAQPRGWIDTIPGPAPLAAGNQVFLLQHPRGEPLQMAIGVVKEFNAKGTRLRYNANSKDGSSGSPCLNADLQLVALHHAHDPAYPPKWNQAIPVAAIQKAWEDRGIDIS